MKFPRTAVCVLALLAAPLVSHLGGPAECGDTIRSELKLWSQVIRDASIKVD